MKKILLLLLSVAAIYPLPAADTDWRKAAREFMAEQDIAPIEIKPGTRFEVDRARDRWAWMQRVFLPPFEQHLTKWPRQAEAARSFVKQALMIRAVHPDVDPKRPWEVLAQEGAALIKDSVDDPLVFWLTAGAVWEFREGTTEARDYLSKAGRHKMIKDYPSVLLAFIKADINEIGVHRNSTMETIARLNIEQYKEMMKSVPDPAVYLPQDDELLLADLEFIFGNINIKVWSAELEQLSSTPHFSPWLREMLRGRRQNFIAWDYRNVRGDTTDEERRRKVAEHQIQARAHFLKAWELRPDRAAGAASMIEIVKYGNGRPEDNLRLWFDRAISVDFDNYIAYFHYLEALRPYWGGSLAKMKAFYCACALTERDDSTLMRVMQLAHDDIEEDSGEKSSAFSLPPMKEVLLASFRRHAASQQVYRRWEHPWRLANLGVLAWQVEDYETAYETFRKVPVPFPRQSRRRLNLAANETDVRGQSAIHAFGLSAEWEAAEEAYRLGKVDKALQGMQDMAARFQGEPPAMVLQRIAACKFEQAFATGDWVPIRALPDLNDWYHRSGFWRGEPSGTLVNTGHDGPAFMLHNGRVGASFELSGVYEIKNSLGSQGLSVMLGYHSTIASEDWVGCAQWGSSNTKATASILRRSYTGNAPQIMPPVNGQTWRFHIICRAGAITYRLNHMDIVIDHRVIDKDGDAFEMPEDSIIGFCYHLLQDQSETHIHHLNIRKLDAPAEPPSESTVSNLESLRSGFTAHCRRSITDLNAASRIEAEQLADELRREQKTSEADKITAFAGLLQQDAGVKAADLPIPAADETALATLLRGYNASQTARVSSAQNEWKTKALDLAGTTERNEVNAFIHAELEPRTITAPEEPLAAVNAFKWQQLAGEWTRTTEVLTGSGDSTMRYELNRKPPFQIEFDINVLEGNRPRLHFGKLKFANESGPTTFGLYPLPKGKDAKLFPYEHNKWYHVTITATVEKTELSIDGKKICDGPKIEGEVGMLQFRGGDWSSKGRTEFRKIRISPLP